jgi:hypothetical protein
MLMEERLTPMWSASFGAEMSPMAGEEDGGIGIEKASHFGVQHRQQGGGNGLIRQTNF